MERLVLVTVGINVNPSHRRGWCVGKWKEMWKLIYPLTGESVIVGVLPFMDPLWGQVQTSERSSDKAQKAV